MQVGDKFILLGGRENNSNVNIYNPTNNSWTIGKQPPFLIHHFQAVEYHGLVLATGAMTGRCCNEPGVNRIMIYDPEVNEWYDGPNLPSNRVRGGAGTVVYKGDIYILAGNTTGHSAPGWVPWLDKYNPETNKWTRLPDAPRARDHFHATIVNDKLYAVAGRRNGEQGLFRGTIDEVDVFDFATNRWSTLPRNIPTPRAGNAVAVLNDEILVIGGERTDANTVTEALNVRTGRWRTLAPMNQKRHGIQAIVNNDNVWIAAGSPNLGGGATRTHERFSLNGFRNPRLTNINRSNLSAPADVSISSSQNITLRNTNGNQAILIQNIRFSNGNFRLNNGLQLPLLLKPNSQISINVQKTANGNKSANLFVDHTGKNGKTTTIRLSGGNAAQIIANGQYFIESSANGQHVANPSSAGSNVRMVNANSNDASTKWTFQHLGNNNYTIRNLRSNDYLEVPFARCGNDANVGTWRGATNDNHRWKISKVGNNYYFQPLHCTSHGMDKNSGNSGNVHLWAFNHSNRNQQFKVRPVNSNNNSNQLIANGNYFIQGSNNELVASPSGANNVRMVSSGGNNPTNNRNQWTFRHLGNNEYTIRNIGSNRWLEVPSAQCGNGANVATSTNANNNNQKWIISRSNDGRFFLRPKHCTSLALDKNSGNGANVHIWRFSANNGNQIFRINPITNSNTGGNAGSSENLIVNGAHFIRSKANGQNAIGPPWSSGIVPM